jgi:2-methylaconitate isomerase
MSQSIAATFMRGGTSKGVFFLDADLPANLAAREAMLLRIIGSPDPYERHTDGMGGATSSTSKVVIIAPSKRSDCDVDFTFGAVAIADAKIDWSGSCGNLSAAVGPFAIHRGLVRAQEGLTRVRIWQVNLGKRIDAYVPIKAGQVQESGHFCEDGVAFESAEIRLEFLQPSLATDSDDLTQRLLPTGNVIDQLSVPGLGKLEVSLINAGNPTVFFLASALKLTGKELPASFNSDSKLAKLRDSIELIRAHAAVAMGLATDARQASVQRPATPKVAWLAVPQAYRTSSGKDIAVGEIDILARIMSMGKLHHAFTGTGSIALGIACAVPGTLANKIARTLPGIATRIGHASGALAVGAEVSQQHGIWTADKAVLSRSARRLMTGVVHLP